MIRLLIGGSPCTHWSIAQTKNRETEPSGIGWELFENYLVALDKFKPDYFLYENNKSMSAAIRDEITWHLGVDPICINSSLVSAQNRQRLYWTNIPGVQQPEDRGILLRDILESGMAFREKGYTLKAQYYKSSAVCAVDGGHFPAPMAAEPVNITSDGKAQCLRASCYKDGIRNMVGNTVDRKTCVAEPVRIGTIENDAKNQDFDSQQYRVYSADGKSVTLCGQGGGVGAKTGLYAAPVNFEFVDYEVAKGQKLMCTVDRMRQGNDTGTRQGTYVYYPNAKKANTLIAGHASDEKIFIPVNGIDKIVVGEKTFPVYEVRNGLITIKGKQYPIKLADGFYIIRKLTVTECMRLQTVPDSYVFPVSDTQAYKMLGNGWTVDVIAHILSHCHEITAEPLDVLSMYDGMACGHIALDKLGAHISRYRATEIDKYAIKTACHNFPDIEQLGDAFQVRFWV